MCTVSIIIPTHNRSAYLIEALSSVQNQTFRDWEAVVVDDGSTDETAQAIDELRDTRIKYCFQPQSGRSEARNRGMAQARGKYLTFLDDDDLFHPKKIEKQLNFLQEQPKIDMLTSDAQVVGKNKRPLYRFVIEETEGCLSLDHFLFHRGILMGSFLFHHSVLEKLNEWFDPSIEPAEDMDFFIRIFLSDCKIAYLPEIVLYYRLHGDNSSMTRYDRSYRKALDKMFSRSDLNENLHYLRNRVYAYAHIIACCRGYIVRQSKIAQFNLLKAIILDKELVTSQFPRLLARHFSCVKGEDREFFRYVSDNLPTTTAGLGLELSPYWMVRGR